MGRKKVAFKSLNEPLALPVGVGAGGPALLQLLAVLG